MSRRAAKRDQSEALIVEAIEAAGWRVWRELPTDLICFKDGTWKLLECKVANRKDGSYRVRTDQAKQAAFCLETGTPYVTTPEAALLALK